MTIIPVRHAVCGAIALVATTCGHALAADSYTLDSSHTFPRFSLNHFGFSTHRGQFNKTAGRLVLDRAAKTGSVEITVQTASIGTGDPKVAFKDADYALLVGARPRGPGMERKDLLEANGKIFGPQGHALSEVASRDVKVLVVGNPANTNCLIAMKNAPKLKPTQFTAMMRLDHNRAQTQIAQKIGQPVASIKKLTVWGNHSATQFPDFANATIGGVAVPSVIDDHDWLRGDFITTVQKRGAAIIEARGASSAASAANAAIDTVVSLVTATPDDDCASVAVTSLGEYGVPEGLTFGFPISSDGASAWRVKEGFVADDFATERIKVTTDELLAERDEVRALGLI